MKNHLKKVTSPKTWPLSRRGRVFITRPLPSGHPLHQGMPLGLVLRDMLSLALTMSEVRKILLSKEVLVDGKRRKDHRFHVGLFDIVSLPSLQKNYRMIINQNGYLALIPIPVDETSLKLGKVLGKSVLKGGKIQYHLHDGRNLSTKNVSNVGDTFLFTVPKQEVQKVFPLKEGVKIITYAGKNAGRMGTIVKIAGRESTYKTGGQDVETVTRHLFVVGEKEPALTVVAAEQRKASTSTASATSIPSTVSNT
ncbi:30S ribosomal protein S4e [Candidatus Woesearchaeota archaeon]|nr:30S ribosomal protein S4e [Candidatus Woesearchaeota archaeon]